jgi:hypothetical protein
MNHDVMPFDLADPKLKAQIDKMIRDVMIILVERAGGEIRIPVSIVDVKPRGLLLAVSVDQDGAEPAIVFKVGRTQ